MHGDFYQLSREILEKFIPPNESPSSLELSEGEQEHLFAPSHKGVNSARVMTRARILSKLAKGCTHQEICAALEVTLPTVAKVRKRFGESGLEAAAGRNFLQRRRKVSSRDTRKFTYTRIFGALGVHELGGVSR